MDNMINNQQNTISTLRNKSWYRLLKVVYILAFIAALVMSFSPLMNDYSYVIQNILIKKLTITKLWRGVTTAIEQNTHYQDTTFS